MSESQRHLVTVWNPSLAHDAIDEHLRILLAQAEAWRRDEEERDEVYVWWGKVRSRNREPGQGVGNDADLRAIADELRNDTAREREVHLYLTDYRSLFVGHVEEIAFDDIRLEDPDRVPAYYAPLAIDCWFRLSDVKRLVEGDLEETIAELSRLSNVHYGNRAVSLYGGMVNLPLVVTRADGERFFDASRAPNVRLWAEVDAERGGLGEMQRSLRHDLFGDEAWEGLHREARVLVAEAETFFRMRRGEPGANFAPAILGWATAIEAQCHALLRDVLAGLPRPARLANVDGRTVDLAEEVPTLGQLAHALQHEHDVRKALHLGLADGGWFVGEFMRLLGDGLAAVRNAAAHGERIDRDTATAWRARLLGIGCVGDIVRLARVRALRR